MANNRFKLKQFAAGASNNGVFGSFSSGEALSSDDPETIQSLPAWEKGWLDATTAASILPRLEEMQGVQYVLCKSILENYREGIPSWLETEDYYKNSICSYTDSTHDFSLYINKTGVYSSINPADDTTNWEPLKLGGGSEFALFSITTAHCLLNNASFLRSDTFSWQSGAIYVGAYEALVAEYNVAGENKTETIEDITITYKLTSTRKKICAADQEENIMAVYAATGSANYYILDTEHERFKLPRNNSRRLIRSWKEGTSWYKLYSDGWCEQGGEFQTTSVKSSLTFIKQMYDTNYNIQANAITYADADSGAYVGFGDLTVSGCYVYTGDDETYNSAVIRWSVQGYVDTSALQDEFDYEYYFIGNTVQNQFALDISAVTENLNEKLDCNLNNATDVGRSNITHLCVPDYSRLESKTDGIDYTAEQDGFIVWQGKIVHSYNTYALKINDVEIGWASNEDWTSCCCRCVYPIAKGDKYHSTGSNYFAFCPVRGA